MFQINFLNEYTAIIINTIALFLILIVSNYSIIGYGIILKKVYLNFRNKKNSNTNFLICFTIGLIFLNFIGFLTYLFSINSKYFNLFIILVGFFVFSSNKKLEIINYKIFFYLITIFYIGLLISKTHEDYIPYHFKYIDLISNYPLILGFANLEINYTYTSFFSYLQKIFIFPFYKNKLLHIPQFLIYLNILYFLFYEIYKKKKIQISFLLLFLFLSIKFTRLSEFGYDYPSGFIILIFLIIFLKNLKDYQEQDIWLLSTIYLYAVTIKITSLFFFPVFMAIFLNFFWKNYTGKFSNKKNKYKIFILIFFIILFSIDNLTRYGCLTYLFEFTCLNKKNFPWVINFQNIYTFGDHVELWAKGYYHQNSLNYLDQKIYLNNFNWLNNWFDKHFFYKIFEFILTLSFLLILILLLKENNFDANKQKINKIYLYIVFSLIVSLFLWFLKLPQLRFGFYIFIGLFMISSELINKNKLTNIKFLNLIIIIAISFYFSKNIFRIKSEFKRNDRYKFVNFPFEYRTNYVENFKFREKQKKKFENLETFLNIKYIKSNN